MSIKQGENYLTLIEYFTLLGRYKKIKIYSISTDDIFGDKIFLNNSEITVDNYSKLFKNVDFIESLNNEIMINPLSYKFISVY